MRITPTEIRLGASAAITALSGIIAYYPTQHWIPAVIAAGAVLGIHVIPAVTQSTTEDLVPQMAPPVITEKVQTMSEDATPEETGTVESMTGFNGRSLMGLAPVTAPEPVPETPAETEQTEAPPVADNVPAGTPDVAGRVRSAAQALAGVANELLEVAKNLS